MKVADCMITRQYENGDIIIKQGEDADYFYMVISGVVKIIRTGDDPVSFNLNTSHKTFLT